MRRARIRGALVGVESVTPEGLKAVFKNFNDAGEALVTRLQAFKANGVHVLGSFIFGLPTDTPSTFDATADLAQRAGVSFAQFVMLTPFPGTVDFAKWERESANGPVVDGIPLTRYWLIPSAQRPKVYAPHPLMSAAEIRERTQGVWDRFYSLSAIWQRSDCVKSMKSRLAFVLISKLYRQMYANTGIATDSARARALGSPGPRARQGCAQAVRGRANATSRRAARIAGGARDQSARRPRGVMTRPCTCRARCHRR